MATLYRLGSAMVWARVGVLVGWLQGGEDG